MATILGIILYGHQGTRIRRSYKMKRVVHHLTDLEDRGPDDLSRRAIGSEVQGRVKKDKR
jgi:hypothetical protein